MKSIIINPEEKITKKEQCAIIGYYADIETVFFKEDAVIKVIGKIIIASSDAERLALWNEYHQRRGASRFVFYALQKQIYTICNYIGTLERFEIDFPPPPEIISRFFLPTDE